MARNKMQEVEAREGRALRDLLPELYRKHALQPNQQQSVAGELGVAQPTLSQWIGKLRLVPITTLVPEEDITKQVNSDVEELAS